MLKITNFTVYQKQSQTVNILKDENSKRTKATIEVSNFVPDKMTSVALPLEFEVPEVAEGKSSTILKTEKKVVPLGGRNVKIIVGEGSTPSEPSTPTEPDNPGDSGNTDTPTDPGDSGNTDKPSEFKGYVRVEPLFSEMLTFKENVEMTENNSITYRLVGAKLVDNEDRLPDWITIPYMYKMMKYKVSRDNDTDFTISFYGVASYADDKPTTFDVKISESVIEVENGYKLDDESLKASFSMLVEYNRFSYISYSGTNNKILIAGYDGYDYITAIFNYCYLRNDIKKEDIVFDPPLPEGVVITGVTYTSSLLGINIHFTAKDAPLKEVPEAEYALQGANLIKGLYEHYSMPEDFSYKWKFSVRVR